jgi:hypothetical protein
MIFNWYLEIALAHPLLNKQGHWLRYISTPELTNDT